MPCDNTRKKISFIHSDIWLCLLLAALTLAVYYQVKDYEFVNFDDDLYVYENYFVRPGLTIEGIKYAFAMNYPYWHPLTWLSHMLDCHLYGVNPGWHHLTNVFFHIASSILLFLALKRMTGDFWQCGFVAVLFALHPLHVESVAWISERKDVLSTFFWMLTMWTYAWYVKRPWYAKSPNNIGYLLVLMLFFLGVMTKPMLVTLPFILLVLDYWPLKRFQSRRTEDNHHNFGKKPQAFRLIWEKFPFIVLVTAICVQTFLSQYKGGVVCSLDAISLNARISNALASYVAYIGKMTWPAGLAVLYPHPGTIPFWKSAGSCLLLVLISLSAVKSVKRHPWFIVGWLWYIVTLIPVIGLVQVGRQALADRYTYVPLIGIFIIIAWAVPEFMAKWRYKKAGLAIIVSALIPIMMLITWVQIRHWANSETLFKHALNVTADNFVAHVNLGAYLVEHGKTDEAIAHYSRTLQITSGSVKPNDYAMAHDNMGVALSAQGRTYEALAHYNEALRINPESMGTHFHIGQALAYLGRNPEAIDHYYEVLQRSEDFAEVHNKLGEALAEENRLAEAITHFYEALRIEPGYVEADENLKNVLGCETEIRDAAEEIKDALRLNPENPDLHYEMGNLYQSMGELNTAAIHYKKALSIRPNFIQVLHSLAMVYTSKKEYDKAISLLKETIKLQPFNPGPYYYTAYVFAKKNMAEKSFEYLKKSGRRGLKNRDIIKDWQIFAVEKKF